MKSAVSHAIKTDHFPEATAILAELYRNAKRGCPQTDMWHATERERCMMRGWSINHEGTFHFTQCLDLCVAEATVRELENMVRSWYRMEQLTLREEFEARCARFPWEAGIPWASRPSWELTLDEFIFGR